MKNIILRALTILSIVALVGFIAKLVFKHLGVEGLRVFGIALVVVVLLGGIFIKRR